jgi:hypothetical protein
MGKLDNKVAVVSGAARSDDSRYITGTQLRVDAGGFVKAKPWKG